MRLTIGKPKGAKAVAKRRSNPELVTNGGFDSAVGWTLQFGATISGGVLNLSGATSRGIQNAAVPITAGDYRWTIDITEVPTGNFSIIIGGTTRTILSGTVVGTYSEVLTTAASTQTLALQMVSNTVKLDNFSVKRVI